jgi:hypothetical protein
MLRRDTDVGPSTSSRPIELKPGQTKTGRGGCSHLAAAAAWSGRALASALAGLPFADTLVTVPQPIAAEIESHVKLQLQ